MSTTTGPAATGPRERNRRGQGGRLRTDIVTAAAELLDEAGTEQAVTLRAVARRVGISAPSIYAHFPNRQAILLAVVQDAFAELAETLHASTDAGAGAGENDAVAQLRAVCTAYLAFAARRPQRYRVMFGGVWNAGEALDTAAVTAAELTELGQEALGVFVTALDSCVATGTSASTDTVADAIALWLGLHGLAHQRTVTVAFPWPADITERLITSLGHLTSHTTGGRVAAGSSPLVPRRSRRDGLPSQARNAGLLHSDEHANNPAASASDVARPRARDRSLRR